MEQKEIDDLIAKLDPSDLAIAIKRGGKFFDIMRSASGWASSGNCRADTVVGGLFRRVIEFDAPGQSQSLHVHDQPHAGIVYRGAAMVEKWDGDFTKPGSTAKKISEEYVSAGGWYDVSNDVWHRILCIEAPFRQWCTFPLIDKVTRKVIYKWDGDMEPYC